MLAERIDADMKDAARAKDARRLGTLRMLKSQMKYREIEKANPLDDADVVGVIGSMIKQRKDSAAQFAKGNRPELAALVQESVAGSGAKGARDMGAVMKVLMPKIAGRAEGKRVSDAVKSALSKLAK